MITDDEQEYWSNNDDGFIDDVYDEELGDSAPGESPASNEFCKAAIDTHAFTSEDSVAEIDSGLLATAHLEDNSYKLPLSSTENITFRRKTSTDPSESTDQPRNHSRTDGVDDQPVWSRSGIEPRSQSREGKEDFPVKTWERYEKMSKERCEERDGPIV